MERGLTAGSRQTALLARRTRTIQGATQAIIFGRVWGKEGGDQLALMKEMGSLLNFAPLRPL